VNESQEPELVAFPRELAGVWANRVDVTRTPHEFNIDFFRSDPLARPPGRVVLVARVGLSPLLAAELIDLLQGVWRDYASGKLPKEMLEGE
jgi:hypothetical protein